jgi:hypothetical protein
LNKVKPGAVSAFPAQFLDNRPFRKPVMDRFCPRPLQNVRQGLITDVSQRKPPLRVQAAGYDRPVNQNRQLIA